MKAFVDETQVFFGRVDEMVEWFKALNFLQKAIGAVLGSNLQNVHFN